jgi:hypothetical protein
MSSKQSSVRKTMATALIGILVPSSAIAMHFSPWFGNSKAGHADGSSAYVTGRTSFADGLLAPTIVEMQAKLSPQETHVRVTPDPYDFDLRPADSSFYAVQREPRMVDGFDSLSKQVAALPEADGWTLMLVGALLTGFQLRRKSKQLSANGLYRRA